jgi:hypothetical protein
MPTSSSPVLEFALSADVQSGPNRGFFHAIAGLWASRGNAIVSIRHDGCERSLWISRGCVVAATSNIRSESLGAILASEGKMDSDLVDPIAREASRLGRSVGDQLVIDHVVTPTEVAEALELQVTRRFAGAAIMNGSVSVTAQVDPMLEVTRQKLGNLTLELFRTHLALLHSQALVKTIGAGKTWMWIDPALLEEAQLRPWESRLVRRAKEPFAATDVLREAGNTEAATRFLAAMIALDAVTFESEKSRAAVTARLGAVRKRVIALDG